MVRFEIRRIFAIALLALSAAGTSVAAEQRGMGGTGLARPYDARLLAPPAEAGRGRVSPDGGDEDPVIAPYTCSAWRCFCFGEASEDCDRLFADCDLLGGFFDCASATGTDPGGGCWCEF